MKKLTTSVALTFAAALALSGCGEADTPTTETVESAESVTEDAPQIPDLVGSWKQSNPNSEENYQQATVTADTITIEWVADGGNTTSIYWIGTFEAPTEENGSFTSVRDKEATNSALLASTEDSKDFMFEGETITYKVSALGTTTTVELEKN
ncbi:hypothetical protein [Arthrobacter bussei]|nr:hypothetical protein [Arthrobacter bussei]